jgi:ATP-dependent Zn protease
MPVLPVSKVSLDNLLFYVAGVLVMAATNRPDAIDPALLRPGRFDVNIKVSTPDVEGRLSILKIHCRDYKLSSDVSLKVKRLTPQKSCPSNERWRMTLHWTESVHSPSPV